MNGRIEKAIETLKHYVGDMDYRLECAEKVPCRSYYEKMSDAIHTALYVLREKSERERNPGEVSDGYHTFNELYHHRAVLLSVICNHDSKLCWKSKKHHDGTMFDRMFIVGINTPYGPVTYHYDIEPYWNYFIVEELDKAPEWDGHTSSDAINRLWNYGINPTWLPVSDTGSSNCGKE